MPHDCPDCESEDNEDNFESLDTPSSDSSSTSGFGPLDGPEGLTIMDGGELHRDTVSAIVAAVNAKGTVSSPRQLASKIVDGTVAIVRASGGLAGTATLKNQSDRYQEKVQERSRVRIPSDARELSYFAGNAGAVATAIKGLVEEAGSPVYATVLSGDSAGQTALAAAGLRQMGRPYSSRTKPGQNVLFYAKA